MRHTRLLFSLLTLAGASLFAQGTASLQFTQSFTTATTGTVVANGPTVAGGPQGSVGFRMVYYIQPGSGTVSALSVELDGAPTATGSYTALTPAPGGGSGSTPSVNPAVTFPQGQNNLCCDFYPFLHIKVNTITVASGAPILIVKVLGYAGTSAAADSSGGGGSGGSACLSGDVVASGTGTCVPAEVVGLENVPFCAGFTPTNGQFVKYTTGGSPSPCYTAALASITGGTCGAGQFVNAVSTGGAITCGTPAGGGSTSGVGLTVYSGLAGIALSNATIFFPVGGGSIASSTEASVQTFQGVAGTVSGFGVNISVALGVTVATPNSVIITWRKNGSNQTVTCTITNPATTCSDTTHSFTFAAGDALDIQAVFTGTIAAAPVWVMDAGIATGGVAATGMVLLEQHTASSSAALNFTTCISASYDNYEIDFVNLAAASNSSVGLQASTNGGSSYDTGANYGYALWVFTSVGGPANVGNSADTLLDLTTLIIAGTPLSGFWRLAAPASATPTINGTGFGITAADGRTAEGQTLAGEYFGGTAMNAFRIIASTGNLASGTVRCYGLSK